MNYELNLNKGITMISILISQSEMNSVGKNNSISGLLHRHRLGSLS